MSQTPHEHTLDSTLALLSDGYTFISQRCRRFQSDIFATRLMLRNVVCVTGEEAARMFYQPDRFTRKLAMPPTTLLLLQDLGSVQMLDGADHRRRKHMFLTIMDQTNLRRLSAAVEEAWLARLPQWALMDKLVLLNETRAVLCRAACRWAGIPLSSEEFAQRTQEFGAMIDGAGAFGPRNWVAQAMRNRTERWAQQVIRRVRSSEWNPPPNRATHIIAWHKDADGELLPVEIAAVELINVLRPIVAIAQFVVFAALALHEHPECRSQLRTDPQYANWFAQEVRRFYPFFPFIGGRVRQEFEWRGHQFKPGAWVLLDIYGTNHDPRIWGDPEQFRPERFQEWRTDAYNFIPQGGGDYATGHRCPGEPATVDILQTAVRLLTTTMRYEVPKQNLSYSLAQFPARPANGFLMANVRPVHYSDMEAHPFVPWGQPARTEVQHAEMLSLL